MNKVDVWEDLHAPTELANLALASASSHNELPGHACTHFLLARDRVHTELGLLFGIVIIVLMRAGALSFVAK